jgi:DNA modification methylase
LRDYGVDGQIGLEETPDEWCARLVAVMREARRVLRSDGVAWIEVGDSYNTSPPGNKPGTTAASSGLPNSQANQEMRRAGHTRGLISSLKPKDLVGAPWLLAFALRADGWYLRSDTIWARPNPMPESVTDRPTKAHSYVFLLSKSARYFYDADAIREQHTDTNGSRDAAQREHGTTTSGDTVAGATLSESPYAGQQKHRGLKGVGTTFAGWSPAGRNARSVWSIPTEPTPFAHFATFPQALVERCIKAGTSEHGACSECGAPWRRVTERELGGRDTTINPNRVALGHNVTPRGRSSHQPGWRSLPPDVVTTHGWEPTCECEEQHEADNGTGLERRMAGASAEAVDAPEVVPCVVLDPFMGSGTTALVARRLGRHAIGIELNAEYLAIAARRLQQLSLLTGQDAP